MKTATELLAEAEQLAAQEDTDAVVAFHQLAKDLVTGKKSLTAAVILKTVTAAGKKLSDLEFEQRNYSNRVRLAGVLASAPEVNAAMTQVVAKLDAANEALQKAIALHAETTGPLVSMRDGLGASLAQIEDARKQLATSCNDPKIMADKEVIDSEEFELGQEYNRLNALIIDGSQSANRLAEMDALLADNGSETWADLAERNRLLQTLNYAKEAETQLEENRQANVQISQRRAALDKRMLLP